MSELIQMENPNQSQAEMRAETPEDDLLKALEESEGDLGKVNKPESAVEQVMPEVIPATEPVIQEVVTPGPPITNPEDIMPRGFEFKPTNNPLKAPETPPNKAVAFVNPDAEPSVDALTSTNPDSPETSADMDEVEMEKRAKAALASRAAIEAELKSAKVIHSNLGKYIEDKTDTSGTVLPPEDSEDGLIKKDDRLAPGSRSTSIEIDKNGGEEQVPQQQVTPELNNMTQEPVIAEVSSTGVAPEAATSALETGEAVAETALAQDDQVVSSLAEGGAIAQSPETPIQAPISEDTLAPSVSVVTERAPVPEARPQNVQAGELPVTEVTAPVSQIEEIRREAVSSEIPGEAPSPEPEADVIDFNQKRQEADMVKNEKNLQNINNIMGNETRPADVPAIDEIIAEGKVYKLGAEEEALETGTSEESQILAEAEPDLKELVIEAGESTEKIAEDHDKYLEDLRNKATERLTNMVAQGETISNKIQELNELISKIDSMRQKLQFLKINRNVTNSAEISKEEAA